MYQIIYTLVYALSRLPMRWLYALSDVIFVLLYYVARYRRSTAWANLTSSFPDKSVEELRGIERRFYRWLGDYVVETVKLISADEETVRSMMEYSNMEILEQHVSKGHSCAIFGAHYCNWEFLTTIPVGMKDPSCSLLATIYHPLRNKAFDRLMLAVRQRNHSVCVPKQHLLRYMKRYDEQGLSVMYGYCFDQSPKWENIHLWLDFLNHDTPVFNGAERISRKKHHAVFFLDTRRVGRGRYHCDVVMLAPDAGALPEGEVMRLGFQRLEAEIHRQPEYYLWTHKRWKRTREEWEKRKR